MPLRASDLARDRGAVAVEFGLVAPVLFVMLFGIIQFGLIFTNQLQVQAAAREGARYAALRYPASQIQTRVRGTAPGVDLSAPSAITVTPVDPSATTVAQNTTVTVSVQTRVPVFLPFISATIDSDGDGFYPVTAVARQRIE